MKSVNCLIGATLFGLVIGAAAVFDTSSVSQTTMMQAIALMLFSSVFMFVIASGVRVLPFAARAAGGATLIFVASCGLVQTNGISRAADTTPQIAAVVSEAVSSDVMRQSDGHFRTIATLGGQDVDMLVDTGASVVLLTFEDAVAAGVDMASLRFNVPVLTANGKSHVATFTIDQINVGSVSVKNIRGAVAEPGQLHASLLGMSFLGAIEEAVIRKDRLILRN